MRDQSTTGEKPKRRERHNHLEVPNPLADGTLAREPSAPWWQEPVRVSTFYQADSNHPAGA